MAGKKRKRNREPEKQDFPKLLRCALLGSGVGLAVFFALVCTAAAALLSGNGSQTLLPYIGIACAAVSAALAGFLGVARWGKNGLLFGPCTALPLLAAVLLSILLLGKGLGMMTLVSAAVMVVSSAAGGVLAVNVKR